MLREDEVRDWVEVEERLESMISIEVTLGPGSCSDQPLAEFTGRIQPITAKFRSVTLIEQIDGSRWTELKSFGDLKTKQPQNESFD